MKKIVCLLVALLLCLSAVAFAEFVPSKTTGDLTRFEVVSEHVPEETDLVVRPIANDEMEYEKKIEDCQKEIVVLQESPSIVEYFGEVKNIEGEIVDLTEMLESETLNVYEFCPFLVGGYEDTYGHVKVRMSFSTPYEKDETVLVLVGRPEKEENGEVVLKEDETSKIGWTAFDGIGVETEDGQVAIEAEFDAETLKAAQEEDAMMAIVSKGELDEAEAK